MNQPCNRMKALLSRPPHPAEPVTCFRLQEVLCDSRSILQRQHGGKDDRKMNREEGKKAGVRQPGLWCVAGADWGISSGWKWTEMGFNCDRSTWKARHLDDLGPSRWRCWWVSGSVRVEVNILISSVAAADGGAHSSPRLGTSLFPHRLSANISTHRLVIYFTISILLNELLQELDLESRIHLWWALERRATGWHFFISFIIWCLFIRHESGFCAIRMVSYSKKQKQKKNQTPLLIRPQKLQVLRNKSLTNKVHKDASATSPLIEFTTLHLDAEGWFIKESAFPYICL